MPYTEQEKTIITELLMNRTITAERFDAIVWQDGTAITNDERFHLIFNASTLRRRREIYSRPHRRAMALLRKHLSAQQLKHLQQCHYFYVTTPNGNTYRIEPHLGWTHLCEQHKSRFYPKIYFCLHEDGEVLPNPDLSLAHMLFLLADEYWFLRKANAREVETQLWDGAWRRRLNAARRDPEHQAEMQAAAERVQAIRAERAPQ